MNQDPSPGRKRRETVVTISLIAILGGMFIFFMNLISMGIFIYVGMAIILLALVGFFHYVLWGQSLTENTAGEREEAELRSRLEGNEWDERE